MPDVIGLREQEKAGIQQELIPEAVGGCTKVIERLGAGGAVRAPRVKSAVRSQVA